MSLFQVFQAGIPSYPLPLRRHVYAAIWRVYLHTYLQPRNRREYSASITIQLVV